MGIWESQRFKKFAQIFAGPQVKFFWKYGLVDLDLSIAAFYLILAIKGFYLGGAYYLLCPVCHFGFVYTAYPTSLVVFASFMVLMIYKIGPRRAPFATLFAVGTFDWITSWNYHLVGAPWYIQGIDSSDLSKFVVLVFVPLVLVHPHITKRACLALVAAGCSSLLALVPGSGNAFIETGLELVYCWSAYLFFKVHSLPYNSVLSSRPAY